MQVNVAVRLTPQGINIILTHVLCGAGVRFSVGYRRVRVTRGQRSLTPALWV